MKLLTTALVTGTLLTLGAGVADARDGRDGRREHDHGRHHRELARDQREIRRDWTEIRQDRRALVNDRHAAARHDNGRHLGWFKWRDDGRASRGSWWTPRASWNDQRTHDRSWWWWR